MAKRSTPHLDKWKNTFRGRGEKLREAAKQALGEVMPETSVAVQSGATLAREARTYAMRTKTRVAGQMRKITRSQNDIMKDAYHDMMSGNYTLDKFTDAVYDGVDEIDNMVEKLDANTAETTGLHQSAIVGKAVVEGNAATIQGLQQMTKTLSNISIKTTQANVAAIKDMALFQMTQTNSVLERMSHQIGQVNANLDALVRFNNETALPLSTAAQGFYSELDQKLYSIGESLAELKDFMEDSRAMATKKSQSEDQFDFRYGFDFNTYKNMVKKNFGNTMFGVGFDMLKGMSGSGAFMDPATMMLSSGMKALIPKAVKKSLGRADKMLTAGINEFLYNLGDRANSTDELQSFIGQVFGKRRPSFTKANMGDFKKDYMGWNGVAQKYLTEVIPSYLSSIESAITKQSERFYNVDTGLFMSKKQVEESFTEGIQNNIEWNMRDFVDKLSKTNPGNLSDDKLSEIQRNISKIVSDQILGNSTSTVREDTRTVRSMMTNELGITGNDLRNIMMEFTDGLHKTQESVNQFVDSMKEDLGGSVYRNLHNTYGKDTSYLYQNADIFKGSMFTSDGRLWDNLSEIERQMEEDKKAKERAGKEAKRKVKSFLNRFKKNPGTTRGSRMSHFVDDRANDMYDFLTGNHTSRDHRTTGSASSQASIELPSTQDDRNLNDAISAIEHQSYDRALEADSARIISQSHRVDTLMRGMERSGGSVKNTHSNSTTNTDRASSQADQSVAQIQGISNTQTENTNILKRLVLSLHSNFLQPLVGGLFGKNGFFRNMFNNEHMKKLKNKLFDEKDGVFHSFTSYMKDQADYIRYVFTGKGYTNRRGETFKDNTNSVLDHLAGGWNFLYTNTMKYLFGNDYEGNDTFKKYFQWMDWKGKRDKKREERAKSQNQEKQTDPQSSAIIEGSPYYENARQQQILLEDHDHKRSPQKQRRIGKTGMLALPGSTASFELMSTEDALSVRDQIVTDMTVASQQAAELIVQSGQNLSTALIGDFEDSTESEKMQEKAHKSLIDRFKQALPKSLAFGAVGAGLGAYTMFHGAGMLGSMFLPGGPISGALLGIGLSMATRSEGLMKFMFGDKDDDGKRMGGLISKRTQEWMKKSMPVIAGGAMLGAAKSLVFGGLGNGLANAPGGFILQSLLPGGAIGGAMLGLGVSLFKNNEKVREILFGKDNGDGKKIGGFLNKDSSRLGKIFAKSGNFIKGGLKGLGVGLITNATLGGAGVIGAALTAGGPIGLGLTGLGIGIASQTKKFQELLFGTEEYDENGNFKGRRKDGLLTRAGNMLRLNVFEPIRDHIQEKAINFAYWAKEKIEYPFRLAFGPILDSFKGIKKNIEDSIHDMFNNIGITITDALKAGFKKVFSPFTKILKFAGNALTSGITLGLQAMLSPITGSLKVLQFATGGKRFKENQERRQTMFEHFGDIIANARNNWANEDDREKGYTGLFGKVRKGINHARDIKQGWDAASASYNNEMAEQGFNSLGWRNVKQERRDLKRQKNDWKNERKNEKRIWKLRKDILSENQYDGDTDFTDDEIKNIQKKAAKFGIPKEWLTTSEDINQFLTHKSDWLDKWNPNSDKTSAEYQARHGMLMRETPEQAKARHDTKAYQEAVLNKFSDVEKAFTKYAAQNALNKRSNLSPSDIRAVTKDLKSKGLTWDDLGFDPADFADVTKIDDADWDDLMKGLYEEGDIQSYKDWYKQRFATIIGDEVDSNAAGFAGSYVVDENGNPVNGSSEPIWNHSSESPSRQTADMDTLHAGEIISFDDVGNIVIDDGKDELAGAIEAQTAILEDILEATSETADMTAENTINDSGMTSSEAHHITGRSYGGKFFRVAKRLFRTEKDEERRKQEDEESKRARGLAIINQPDKENDDSSKAGISSGINEDTSSDGEKKGFLGKTATFFGGMFGSLTKWLLSSNIWTKLGIGATLMGLFGDQIITIGSAIAGFIEDHIWPKVSGLLGTVWNGLQKHIPALLGKVNEFIIKNMPTIISNALNLGWTAITTLGKMAINGLADFFHLSWKPFDLDEGNKISSYGTDTYDTQEDASVAGISEDQMTLNDDGTVSVIANGYYRDENGDLQSINPSQRQHAVLKTAYKMATSKTTRVVGKHLGKGALKTAGWVTGIIPGAKLVKGIANGVKNTAKGVKSIAHGIRGLSKKGAESAGEATIKNVSKAGIKGTEDKVEREIASNVAKAGKEGAEAAVKDSSKKGILNFLNNVKNKILGMAKKVEKWIGSSKFGSAVKSLFDTIITKIKGKTPNFLKKAASWITEKVGKATAKAAGGLVPFLNVALAFADGIYGWTHTDELFDTDSPTLMMKTVSTILQVLLGTSVGVWFDLLFEFCKLFTGLDVKKEFAVAILKFLGGEDQAKELEYGQAKLEVEAEKYNKKNGTNLNADQYQELKNEKKYSFLGFQFGSKKMSDEELKSYEATDTEVKAHMNGSSAGINSGGISDVKFDTDETVAATQDQITAYTGQDLLYGAKHRKQYANSLHQKGISYGVMTQSDPRWGDYELGKFPDGSTSTMATGGCGPTALASVANSFGIGKSPLDVAQYAKSNGFIQDGGSTSGLFSSGASAIGLSSKEVGQSSVENYLYSGAPMILSGESKSASSPYTDAGHVVVANGVDESGNAIVNNPMDQKQQRVPISTLKSGMTHAWAYSAGGQNVPNVTYGNGAIAFGLTNQNGFPTLSNIYGNNGSSLTDKKRSSNKDIFASMHDNKNLPVRKSDSLLGDDLMAMNPFRNSGIFNVNWNELKWKTKDGKDPLTEELLAEAREAVLYEKYRANKDIDSPNASIKDFRENYKKYKDWTEDKEEMHQKAKTTYSTSGYQMMATAMNDSLNSSHKNRDGDLNIKAKKAISGLSASDQEILKKAWTMYYARSGEKRGTTMFDADDAQRKSYENQASEKYSIAKGTMKTDHILWNSAEFYNGMKVGSLRVLAKRYPNLLTDASIPLFKNVYRYFVKDGKFTDVDTVSTSIVTGLLTAGGMKAKLGGDGWEAVTDSGEQYQYRNGFPFFYANDDRWNDLEWKGGSIRNKGSDILSLAAIATAFGNSIADPREIHREWLTKYPQWGSSSTGINENEIFKDGGFNALTSTQVLDEDGNGSRVKVTKISNASILSTLQDHYPVYMTGYRYPGSLFGYKKDKKGKKGNSQETGSVVGVFANDSHMAINNPYDKDGTPDILSIQLLKDKLKDGSSVIKNAYKVSGPNDSSLPFGNNGLSDKTGPSSDYTSMENTSGLAKISALIKNIGAVGDHLLTSMVDGTEYRSIWELNEAKVKEDSTGVGNASVPQDEQDLTDESKNNSSTDQAVVNTTDPSSGESDSQGESSSDSNTGDSKKNLGVLQGNTLGGWGGGSRDFTIVYGPKKKKKKSGKKKDKDKSSKRSDIYDAVEGNNAYEKVMNSLNAVQYLSQAEAGGENYNTAKQSYLNALKNNNSSNSDTSSSQGTQYTIFDASNVDLSKLTPEQFISADLKSLPKPSPKQIEEAIKKNWQGSGSVFKKGDEVNDSNGLYKAQTDTNLSVLVPLAIGAWESGWGKSNIAKNKGNLWGWGAVNSDPYNGAKNFNPNDMGASFGLYSKALLEKYYDQYGLKSISEIGSGGGNGNIAYAQDGHGNASTSWTAGVKSTGSRNIRAMQGIKSSTGDSVLAGAEAALKTVKGFGNSRAIGYGGNWLAIVQQVKAIIADGKGYSQSSYKKVSIGGETVNVRRDCSGFVSACCHFYGAPILNQTSTYFTSRNHPELEKSGFNSAPWPGWDKLVPGDIISRNGHVEIFAGNKNGGHYVYNVGSDASANNPNATRSAKSSYTTIWRPKEAGSVSDLLTNSNSSQQDSSNISQQSSGSVANMPKSPFEGIFSSIGGVVDAGSLVSNMNTVKGPGSNPMVSSLGGTVTSVYGQRKSSLGNEFHRGIDISANKGSSIKSPISGRVVNVGSDVAGYGNYAMIQDAKGYNHLFAHMNGPSRYSVGSSVGYGDSIGEVGTSGRSTGDHLHYEIRRTGNKYSAIDPMTYDYSSVGKDLNITKQNTSVSQDSIGGGNHDIPTALQQENLNVDLDNSGVESRLDTLIGVMSDFAKSGNHSGNSNITQTTNNTTNVSYGSGKKRSSKSSSKKTGNSDNEMAKALMEMHKEIAGK